MYLTFPQSAEIDDIDEALAKLGHTPDRRPVTAAILGKIVRHHTPFQIRKADCVAVSGIDNAKKGREIFGGGFLLSERAAAERIQLSVRERRLVKSLNTVNP